ncbi:MAG: O-antigen ligase family protein [Actinobacteria bacterium]|nr:O-antigen ligase family protein [Actinomycetota bacterium]
MSIESPPRLSTPREPAGSTEDRRSVAEPWLRTVVIGLAVLALAAFTAVWPALTLVSLGLVLIIGLAFVAPPFALVGAILLYGLEGAVKIGLARELPALGVTPQAVGAAVIDFAFLVAVLGIVRQDRGRTLLEIWRNVGRPVRIALALLATWIAVSLIQLGVAGDVDSALAGFRLSQAYVLAVPAGAMLLARWRPEHVVNALVGVLLVITAYAAFRAVAGPSETERAAAFARSTTALVPSEDGVIFRNSGSFSSAIGLASYLVPAGVFLFALGLAFVRLRLAAWFGFALVIVALVGSYVRTSLVAIAAGMLCAAALLTFASGLARRRKIALGLAAAPLLVVLIALGALVPNAVSGGSQAVEERAAGLLDPLSDPSLTTRVERWRESLDTVQAHPLGTGLGTVGSATQDSEGRVQAFADNSYLKVLQEQGPLGAVPFILAIFGTLIAIAARAMRSAMPLRGLATAAVAASASFFLLAWTSEAIEQPGKVLAWLLLGVALWSASGVPERRRRGEPEHARQTAVSVRPLVGWLPGWARSRYALVVPVLLVAVPVAVSLLRDSHFDATLEVFPATPPGNAAASSDDHPALRAVVANASFQFGTKGWKPAPGVALRRSAEHAYSGSASLASVRDGRSRADEGIALTEAVLPASGRYTVQAWVRLPSGYSAGAPEIELAGFADSSRVAARTGDPTLHERWQLISSDYVVESQDKEGAIVLATGSALPGRGQVLHWDDVRVLSDDADLPPPDKLNLVSNPGFEHGTTGWGDPAAAEIRRSERLAHTGSASLRSSITQAAGSDTNAGHTYVVLPRAGTYRVKAWVYFSPNVREGRAAVFLEGFSGSEQLAQRLGDPERRGTWQWISTDYEISPQDLEGSLVLRYLPAAVGADSAIPNRGGEHILNWDDVSVTAPRRDPPSDARAAAAELRAALEEPQLRADVARLTADDSLYDPRRVTIERSARKGRLSFLVTVANEVPDDANRLSGPLRSALLDAARRVTRREAEKKWQQLISIVGENLPRRRRELLERRAHVLQRIIGAQPADVVAPPAPSPAPNALTQARQQRVHESRQKIISRIAENLPPWQRTLVQQQADDVQRMIAADTAGFVVLPSKSPVEPTRLVDRLVADLPGSFPLRTGPFWAGAAGLMCALLLLGMLATTTAVRRRAARGQA